MFVKFILLLVNQTLQIMKSPFLFPFWFRYLGLVLIVAHVPVVLFRKQLGLDSQDDTIRAGLFNSHHLFFIFTALLMLIGLFFLAFAKEKIEDEQISKLRLDSLKWAICLNYLILIISLIFTENIHHILELNLWVPLIFFIIRFRWAIFRLNLSLNREE
jgi:uncharacterized membrane protein YkvI